MPFLFCILSARHTEGQRSRDDRVSLFQLIFVARSNGIRLQSSVDPACVPKPFMADANWVSCSRAKIPPIAISSSWVPTSTSSPLSTTQTRSARFTVDSRCATMITVRLSGNASRAANANVFSPRRSASSPRTSSITHRQTINPLFSDECLLNVHPAFRRTSRG